MINIKGLLIFEEQGFFKKLKGLFGMYETKILNFDNREVFVLKTSSYNDTVRRRFLRRRISSLAIIPENERYKTLLKGEGFNLILKNKLIKNKLCEIIKKYAGSSGIKKGKLKIGLAFSDATETLEVIKGISDWISEIYMFGEKNGRNLYAADSYFKETGITVVLAKETSLAECDILVAENESAFSHGNFKGGVIYADGSMKGTLNGVKLNIPKEAKIDGCDDLLSEALFGLNLKLSGFNKKST